MVGKTIDERIKERKFYEDKLISYIGSPVIKVLTGMRRVGKSYILKSIIQKLIRNWTYKERNILYINKELPIFDTIANYQDLKEYFENWVKNVGKNQKILFVVDEVQDIIWREKYINWLLTLYHDQIDIFITGSNSHLLSSDLATYITWRYISFHILPLSFQEFCEFGNFKSWKESFWQYLKYGGLPGIFDIIQDEEHIFTYLRSIYETIIFKDIVSRYQIKNIDFFQKLYKYLGGNVWNIFSARSISNFLKNQNISMKVDTIIEYIHQWLGSFLLYKNESFDPYTKKYFSIFNKYYWWDIWMRNAVVWFDPINNMAWMLENYTYLILQRFGYTIKIWRLKNNTEIDFIAEKNWKKIYIQVCYLLWSPETIQREYQPLETIDDNRPKYVVSLDDFSLWFRNGIEHISLRDIEKYV